MASATIIHLGLGTRNHQRQRTTKIKLKAATKFQLWTMKFDLYIIFIKYCSGFQVLNSAPVNHLQHRPFLQSLSCCCRRESSISSNKINARQSLEGVFSTLQALWLNGFHFYSNDPFISLCFDSVVIFLFACVISL